jgi:hypothetical protein
VVASNESIRPPPKQAKVCQKSIYTFGNNLNFIGDVDKLFSDPKQKIDLDWMKAVSAKV